MTRVLLILAIWAVVAIPALLFVMGARSGDDA